MRRVMRGIADALAGVGAAVRGHPLAFLAGAVGTAALSVLLPPLVLSLARKPVDYFTINPWLRRLPDYLASDVPAGQKAVKLWDLALFWFSADSPQGGTEWGFAVDVRDLARIALTSLLFGAYFALWATLRRWSPVDWRARVGRQGGAAGALASAVGLSTGPCSVMGCGAPVLPVVGLVFAGLSSTTLALLAGLAAVSATGMPLVMTLVVGYLGWRVGAARWAADP